jgi:hypothetical protein
MENGFPHGLEMPPSMSDSRQWLSASSGDLSALLCREGVVLLRNLPMRDHEDFLDAVTALTPRHRRYISPQPGNEGRLYLDGIPEAPGNSAAQRDVLQQLLA